MVRVGEIMVFFQYDRKANDAEYYEILEKLIVRWEYEVVEFKARKVLLTRIR